MEQRVVEGRPLLTSEQRALLLNLPARQKDYCFAVLQWIFVRSNNAIREGILVGEETLQIPLLNNTTSLRGTLHQIGDELMVRMPMVYMHYFQVMVDALLFFSPLALFPSHGVFAIVSVGILTIAYTGLLDLAKVFLDPFQNEHYREGILELDLGYLMRDMNKVSMRWMETSSDLPLGSYSLLPGGANKKACVSG